MINKIPNKTLSSFIANRAILTDYHSKVTLSEILLIWELCTQNSKVDIKISSFSFEGLKFLAESDGALDFTSIDQIINYVQGKEGAKFKIEI